jgi:hypothetical protein
MRMLYKSARGRLIANKYLFTASIDYNLIRGTLAPPFQGRVGEGIYNLRSSNTQALNKLNYFYTVSISFSLAVMISSILAELSSVIF